MSGLFFLFFKATRVRVKTKDSLDLNNWQRSSPMPFFSACIKKNNS
jgi:hypothetical protein